MKWYLLIIALISMSFILGAMFQDWRVKPEVIEVTRIVTKIQYVEKTIYVSTKGMLDGGKIIEWLTHARDNHQFFIDLPADRKKAITYTNDVWDKMWVDRYNQILEWLIEPGD